MLENLRKASLSQLENEYIELVEEYKKTQIREEEEKRANNLIKHEEKIITAEEELASLSKLSFIKRRKKAEEIAIMKDIQQHKKSTLPSEVRFSPIDELNIKEEINYEKRLEKINNYNLVTDFGLTLKELIAINKKNNQSTVIDGNSVDLTREGLSLSNSKQYEDINELVAIHLTDYLPVNSEIISSQRAAATVSKVFELNGKFKEFDSQLKRNTIHFSLNGPVGSHSSGNWENKKYSVLKPLKEADVENIEVLNAVDTYFKGTVSLNEDEILLVPYGEDTSKLDDSKYSIIEYKDISIEDATSYIVAQMGFTREKCGAWSWMSSGEVGTNTNRIIKIQEKYGLPLEFHSMTKDKQEEMLLWYLGNINSMSDLIYEELLTGDLSIKQLFEDMYRPTTHAGINKTTLHLNFSQLFNNEYKDNSPFFLKFEESELKEIQNELNKNIYNSEETFEIINKLFLNYLNEIEKEEIFINNYIEQLKPLAHEVPNIRNHMEPIVHLIITSDIFFRNIEKLKKENKDIYDGLANDYISSLNTEKNK